MTSCGYRHDGEACQIRFEQLYKGYEAARHHNHLCSLKTRRRPPFYYKMYSLFAHTPHTQLPAIRELIFVTVDAKPFSDIAFSQHCIAY